MKVDQVCLTCVIKNDTRLVMAKIITVRIPDEIEKRLEKLSSKTKRPKSFYIKDMLEKYLEEYEDAFLALDRLNEKNAKYYTTEEVEKLLSKRT